MKILVIGVRTHIFIRSFVSWMRKTNTTIEQIDIFSIGEKNVCIKKDELFNNIIHVESAVLNIPKVRRFTNPIKNYLFRKKIRKIVSEYDIIHIHYIENFLLDNARFINKINGIKIIVSIWGSDFYRRDDYQRIKMLPLLERANLITTTNIETEKEISWYYNKKAEVEFSNIKVLRFGLEPLEYLKEFKFTKTESRNILDIPNDSIAICIGYNSNPAQQHIDIIKSIAAYSDKLPLNVFFVLPLTYGPKGNYTNEIVDELKKNKFKYILFTEYMSNINVAHLRNASDIMIQLQITDQFSGSMQEYMYAGNVVITGSWLPYKKLKDNGIYYRTINSVEQTGVELAEVIKHLREEQKKAENNKDIIYKLSSWHVNIKQWNNIYLSLSVNEY